MVAHGSSTFTDALSTLKAEGSALLVVGTVPQEKFGAVTTHLLGDQEGGPRRRLFVTTNDRLDEIRARLPEPPGLPLRQSTRVITITERERSAAAPPIADSAELPTEQVSKGELSALSERILQTIDEFERLAGSLEPAELRVSVDSLTPILDAHDEEDVFRMVHLLNHLVRKKSGMIHYHLPVERESATVRMFAPLFDAVVELRMQDGALQQRWHLQDSDISSEWLPVT
ncbi:MAG: hypothetical protein ABEI31_00065 [Halodesulfurarchaeum sp.]